MATTPILAPDGTIRDIPNEQVDAAVQGGGQRVTSMLDPQGVSRWIPLAQVPSAIRAGAMPDNAVSATTGVANRVLAKYGISVGTPPDARTIPPRGTLPVNQSDLAQDTLGGIGSIKSKPLIVDYQDPVSAAAISTAANMPTPGQAVKGALAAGSMPIVGAMQSYRAYKNPPTAQQSLDSAAGQLGVNPQSVRENAANGDYPALAGNVLAPIITLALLKKGGDAISSTAQSGIQSLPPEVQARMITRAVNPAADQWNGYIDAVKNEAGNIQGFAQRSGNPLQTNQDWANAAKGAAQEAQQFYQQNILQPNANVSVEVGPDFNGNKLAMGESNQRFQTSVADLENRLDSINDQLRPGYVKPTTGQTLTELDRSGLQNERAMVQDKLYNALAERTGLQPIDIQGLRQRYGRLYQIANQTQAAVNFREHAMRNRAEGTDAPESGAEAVFRLINRLRGGAAGIADKSLRGALTQTDIGATAYPQPTQVPEPGPQPNPIRTPFNAQVNTAGQVNPMTFQPYTPQEQAAMQAQQAQTLQARGNTIQEAMRQAANAQAQRAAMRAQRISERLKDQPPPRDTYGRR